MILKCYSVFDKAINSFGRPWYVLARGEAVRTFMDAVGDKESPFNKHPEDYMLFQVGEFDDQKGVFTQEEPEKVLTALEVLQER